jgi:hypothetical protein
VWRVSYRPAQQPELELGLLSIYLQHRISYRLSLVQPMRV